MTNNEAIKMLRTIKRTVLLGNRKFKDAIDVAISALEGKNINVHSNNQIDRKAAIDAIDRFNVCGVVEEDWVTLRDALQALPSVQSEQQWIPCSERMPYAEDGNSGILLVTCGYKNVEDTSIRWMRRLWFDGEYWNDVDGERYNQIVYAWMPLPKSYKGD